MLPETAHLEATAPWTSWGWLGRQLEQPQKGIARAMEVAQITVLSHFSGQIL